MKVLSIVIPTHNSQNTITNLLISIHTSEFRHFGDIEVLVVDDYSTDKTLEEIQKLEVKSQNYKSKVKS